MSCIFCKLSKAALVEHRHRCVRPDCSCRKKRIRKPRAVPEGFLTADGCAKRSGRSTRTLRLMAKYGIATVVRKGRDVFYSIEEAERLRTAPLPTRTQLQQARPLPKVGRPRKEHNA